MARRLIGLALIWLAGGWPGAAPDARAARTSAVLDRASASAPARHVVVLTVDGTSIEDWTSAGAFRWAGGAALLATRTPTSHADPALYRAGAYTSFGAGAVAEVRRDTSPAEPGGEVVAGALGETLARRGLLATAVGDAIDDLHADAPAGLAVMDADATVAVAPGARVRVNELAATTSRRDANAPGGWRTDVDRVREEIREGLGWASVVVADLGDAWRGDRTLGAVPEARRRWLDRALGDADRLAGDVLAMLGPEDTLVVASLVPPLGRVREGVHLAAVAMSGPRGLVSSGTTRRDGVLSLIDLAPTALRRLGIDPPAEMIGRPARVERVADPLAAVAELDADLVRALRSRRPLTRLWLLAAAVLAILSFLTVTSGRGRAGGGRTLPFGWRDVLAWGTLAAAAAPAAMLIAPLFPGSSVAAAGWWTLALAAGLAFATRLALGHDRALGAVAAFAAVVVAGDLVAGSSLAARSALGFQIAGGGRFYGIDEGLLGVLLGASLIAAGSILDRAGHRRRALTLIAGLLALVAVLAGAPSFGSKFGAPFTLVPAFGVFVVLASGHRIDRRTVIGIAIATVLLSGSLAAADALSSPESRSHIGREIAGGTPVGPLIGRKLRSLLTITATTVWLPAAIALAGPGLVLLARRRDVGARAFWGRPGRRAALWAVSVGAVLSLGANDTGIIVVAPAFVLAAAAFYGPLLAPD